MSPWTRSEDIKEVDDIVQHETADSHSDIESFHSAPTLMEPPTNTRAEAHQARSPRNASDQHSGDNLPAVEIFPTLRHAVTTASSRTCTIRSQKDVPVPCSCVQPLRYCQCLGTGYLRLCSSCPGIGCGVCAGMGVVPAFPAQRNINIKEVVQQRGAPPGLDLFHDEKPSAAASTAPAYAGASPPKVKPWRPSLRDIVLGRRWRKQEDSAPQPEVQWMPRSLPNSQHQPYYIQTPESLTLVLDGPRPADYELDLPSLIVDQPLMPALPLHQYIDGPPPWQAWDGFNSRGKQESTWDIFSALRDDAGHSLPPMVRPNRQVRNWLAGVDEDGPVPNEYRSRHIGRSGR